MQSGGLVVQAMDANVEVTLNVGYSRKLVIEKLDNGAVDITVVGDSGHPITLYDADGEEIYTYSPMLRVLS